VLGNVKALLYRSAAEAVWRLRWLWIFGCCWLDAFRKPSCRDPFTRNVARISDAPQFRRVGATRRRRRDNPA
jgi:hypothetical protein